MPRFLRRLIALISPTEVLRKAGSTCQGSDAVVASQLAQFLCFEASVAIYVDFQPDFAMDGKEKHSSLPLLLKD